MISTKARAVIAPTPGCLIRRNTSGRCLTCCSTTALNSSIVGFNRSSSSSKSCRRRAAQGASRSDSNWARPDLLHSAFLRRTPSFHGHRLQLIRDPRPHLQQPMPVPQHWRRSRFSALGTHPRGKRSSSSSCSSSAASRRSVFCFRTRLALIFAGSPIHSSNPSSASSRSNQRHVRSPPSPLAHCILLPSARDRTSLLLHRCDSVAVHRIPRCRYLQMRFAERSGDSPHLQSTYRLLLPEPWVHKPKVYSVIEGADIVMKSSERKASLGIQLHLDDSPPSSAISPQA